MAKKKKKKDNLINLKNFASFVPKKPNLSKFKVNPINIIDNASNKIENFYSNFKSERDKQKKLLIKKRITRRRIGQNKN